MPDLSTSPQSVQQTATVSQQTLPDWYNQYIQGLATRGAGVAGQGYQQYTGDRVAGFSPLQQQAFAGVGDAANSYQPYLANSAGALTQMQQQFNAGLPTANQFGQQSVNAAQSGAQGALSAYNQFGQQGVNAANTAASGANAAVAGPAQTWNANTAQKYMSPYTSGVVDEIARLGNRNLEENIMPGVNSAFIGSGQFGSARNAAIIGNSMRDAQADISGQQAKALESGYSTAANIFGEDANRAQAQGVNQANTAIAGGNMQTGALNNLASGLSGANIQGGQLASGANTNAGSQFSTNLSNQANVGQNVASGNNTLANSAQTLGLNGIGALNTLGTQQQTNQQTGLDLAYKDFQDQTGWDANQLNQFKTLMSGLQLPAGNTTITNAPGPNGASPLDWINSLVNGAAGATPAPGTNVGPPVPAAAPAAPQPLPTTTAPPQPRARGGRVRRFAGGGQVPRAATRPQGALGQVQQLQQPPLAVPLGPRGIPMGALGRAARAS